MNISIKSYQTSIPAKAPAQEGLRSENTTKSTTENTNSSTAATVSISSSAQARYIQSSAIERQTSMSQSELKSLYAKGQKDIYNFGHLIAGGSYNKDDLLPKTDDPARLTLGQKSLDWAIGLSQSQCHQPKLQPCPRQTPRSSQPPWPSGDDQASAAQSGGLAGLAVM